jgi:hypothetical protein
VLEEAFEWLAQCRETGAQREGILRCAQDDIGPHSGHPERSRNQGTFSTSSPLGRPIGNLVQRRAFGTPVLEAAFEWLAQCRETGAQREGILRCAQDDTGARMTSKRESHRGSG